MKLTCPSCGAQASADAWASDADARRALQLVATLDRDVARLALPYLSLFRPKAGRGLFWARVCRLLEQLKLLVETPEISWGPRPHLANSPAVWARAIEKLLAQPPSDLPLKNHNYLRVVAYEIAERLSKCTKLEIPDKPGERLYTSIPEARACGEGEEGLLEREEAARKVRELMEMVKKGAEI